MKAKHTKYFLIFYVVALLMMGSPLVELANKPVMLLGMPLLLCWLLGWTALCTGMLILQYSMDLKATAARRKAKEGRS